MGIGWMGNENGRSNGRYSIFDMFDMFDMSICRSG